MTNEMLGRYQQAQHLIQGILSNRLVLNDAVFPHWMGNSDYFWYERETREGKEYRLVDAQAATNEAAFEHKILASMLETASGQSIDPDNLPIRIFDITLSPRQVRFQAFNKQWVFESESLSCDEVKSSYDNGLLSPDGQRIAFVRDNNLWVQDLISGEEHPLTQDGTADYPYAMAPAFFGAPSTPAVQAVWSPNSQQLFTYQLDFRQVASRSIIHHVPQDGTTRPQILEYKSAYPDDEHIETYRLVTINVKTRQIQAANHKNLPLGRFGAGFFSEEKFGWWANDSRRAYFVEVTRGAKKARVVEYDTQTGVTRVLFEESSDTFVKLSHDLFEPPLLLPLPDSDELIWFSERNGWGHLYLYDLNTGELKHPISEGEWLVRDILHADIERRELLIQTAARDSDISPYYRDVCRVHLDTGAMTPVVCGAYDHLVHKPTSKLTKIRTLFNLDAPGVSGVSPSGDFLITMRSRVDKLPVSLLVDREGNEVLTLETADAYNLKTDGQLPEPIQVTSADGETDIHGVIYRPPGFSPNNSYPVLDFSCGHPGFSCVPHASFVNGPLYGDAYLSGLAYAALGFVVVAIEGRGTPYRHKAFQDESYGCMSSANTFEDRMTGLRQLAQRYPYMDLDRVGIVAYDGMTSPVYGLLEQPDFYKVGVMIALSDSRFESASRAEMFEGTNLQLKSPYPESLAALLQGKLLLIHGMLDSVTPPVATFRLIDALQQNNKDFDMLLLPNEGHDIPSYALRRTWDYLVEHLQHQEPANAFNLTTGWDLLREPCQ